ncbi:hypothetical protein [Limnovirga soli]|nr:hypothetical protein [Limnovirga soli]
MTQKPVMLLSAACVALRSSFLFYGGKKRGKLSKIPTLLPIPKIKG